MSVSFFVYEEKLSDWPTPGELHCKSRFAPRLESIVYKKKCHDVMCYVLVQLAPTYLLSSLNLIPRKMLFF